MHSIAMQAERKRPIGVTIVAILTIICSVLALINAIYFTTVGPILSIISPTYREVFEMAGWTWYVTVSGIFGVMMLGIAIAFSVAASAILHAKRWARVMILSTSIASIISGVTMTIIVAFGIIAFIEDMAVTVVVCILNGVILWYLSRQNVRSYFSVLKVQT